MPVYPGCLQPHPYISQLILNFPFILGSSSISLSIASSKSFVSKTNRFEYPVSLLCSKTQTAQIPFSFRMLALRIVFMFCTPCLVAVTEYSIAHYPLVVNRNFRFSSIFLPTSFRRRRAPPAADGRPGQRRQPYRGFSPVLG